MGTEPIGWAPANRWFANGFKHRIPFSLLNYTSDLKAQIHVSEEEVKQYLIDCFVDILADSVKQEAILGCLFYEDQSMRFDNIISLLNEIIHGL
jgi:hypothetical protein